MLVNSFIELENSSKERVILAGESKVNGSRPECLLNNITGMTRRKDPRKFGRKDSWKYSRQ